VRTYDELKDEVRTALGVHDLDALTRLAGECQEGDVQLRLLGMAALAAIAMYTGDFERAIELYTKILEGQRDLGNRAGESSALTNLGLILTHNGLYAEALEHLNTALDIDEELGDRLGQAITLNSIGVAYESALDYERALDAFECALELHQEQEDVAELAMTLGNLGNIELALGRPKAALERYGHSLDLFEQLGGGANIALLLGNMAHAHLDAGEVDEARRLMERYDTIELHDPMAIGGGKILWAKIHREVGEYEHAAALFDQALEIVEQHDLKRQVVEVHREYMDLAKRMKDLDLYVKHSEIHRRVNEELRGAEASKRLTMQAKQHELDHMRRERAQQRSVLYATLPRSVADRLLRGEEVRGDQYDEAAILILDIVSFTSLSSGMPPGEVLGLLEKVFSTLDSVAAETGLVKIKTIGDSYIAAGFPAHDGSSGIDHVLRNVVAAIQRITCLSIPIPSGGGSLQFRFGLHVGPVIAGVVGTDRLQYDVWGEAVNRASVLERTGEPGRAHISESVRTLVLDLDRTDLQTSEADPVTFTDGETQKTYWIDIDPGPPGTDQELT